MEHLSLNDMISLLAQNQEMISSLNLRIVELEHQTKWITPETVVPVVAIVVTMGSALYQIWSNNKNTQKQIETSFKISRENNKKNEDLFLKEKKVKYIEKHREFIVNLLEGLDEDIGLSKIDILFYRFKNSLYLMKQLFNEPEVKGYISDAEKIFKKHEFNLIKYFYKEVEWKDDNTGRSLNYSEFIAKERNEISKDLRILYKQKYDFDIGLINNIDNKDSMNE